MIDEFLVCAVHIGLPGISKVQIPIDNTNNRTIELWHGICYLEAQPMATDGLPNSVAATKPMLKYDGI